MILITALVVLTGANHLTAPKTVLPPAQLGHRRKTTEAKRWGFIAIVLVILFKAAAVDSMDGKAVFQLVADPGPRALGDY